MSEHAQSERRRVRAVPAGQTVNEPESHQPRTVAASSAEGRNDASSGSPATRRSMGEASTGQASAARTIEVTSAVSIFVFMVVPLFLTEGPRVERSCGL